MKSKIIFYSLLAGFVGLSAYFAAQLFQTEEKSVSHIATPAQLKSKTSESSRSTSRASAINSSSGSIWSDDSAFTQKIDVNQLKESAELKQAKSLLQELYKMSDKSLFEEKAKELMKQYPEAAEFPAALADLYYNQGDLIQAEAYLKQTLERAPNYIFGRNSLADIYMKQGKFAEAKQTYRQVMDEVDNLYAYQGYLGVAAMTGEMEAATQDLIEMSKAHPEKTNLALSVADIYFAENKLNERDQILKATYARDPNHPILNQVLAQEAMIKGDLEAVISYGQKAVDNEIDRRRKISMLQIMIEAAEELKQEDRVNEIRAQLRQVRTN